jgi:hypothetical protein
MRKFIQVSLLAIVGVLATAAVAVAAPWTAGPGTSQSGGIVTLNNSGGAGTSYENADLQVPVQNGDTITFEWRSDDVTCAGGTPRVFIQGGAYNTFDQDPAGPGACGTDSNSDGWNEVTGTISGITAGPAGHTGIVNDNPADPGTIQVRNLVIAGVAVLPPGSAAECKNGGWQLGNYKNQGACVSSFAKAK